jgi:hypothetical protein
MTRELSAGDVMATDTTELDSTPPGVRQKSVGLVANGSAGAWDVAVDESLAGPEKWYLQIEGPSYYLYFSIRDPQAVDSILAFLDEHQTTSRTIDRHRPATLDGNMEAGCFDGATTVRLLWDEDDSGRLVILVSGGGECTARSTISGGDVRDFTEALRQMRDELRETGLLANAS